MTRIRLGIIGLGNMGQAHADNLLAGRVPECELVALADPAVARLDRFPAVRGFLSAPELIRSNLCEAVLIATPHYSHTTIGIEALRAGLHVLMEKPISVHVADANRLLAAHANPRQVFGAMFNQRTDPCFRKIREMIGSGELGEIRRVHWTITNWFRSAAYYASGGWRATWAGEGGGVLLNQAPHNLDLLQWLFGMPVWIRAQCRFGRYHAIEVEDDVTAYMEFPNGASGVFITSTGEAPGTNRLEIAAENGRLVCEDNKLTYLRNAVPMSTFSLATDQPFGRPEATETVFRFEGSGGQHVEIMRNFGAAIAGREPLLAPAAEGLHSVALANAMLLSTWTGEDIPLPLDGTRYEEMLRREVAKANLRVAGQ